MEIKKIVLIEPQAPNYHVFSKFPLPRLGLPIIGTLLRQKGFAVKIFVEDLGRINWQEVAKADLVGISTITSTAPRAYELIKKIKRIKPHLPIVIGGVHATFCPEEALCYADFCIRGEGEIAFLELVGALQNNDPEQAFAKIANLSFKNKKGKIKHNNLRPLIDLDDLPFPDLSLLNAKNLRILPIQTSRGCPFNCVFCSVVPMFGRKMRFRKETLVLEELERGITAYQPRHIFFYDDNFGMDKNRMKRLLNTMLENLDYIPPWSAQVRVDLADDEEALALMQKTNCFYVYLGLESINPKTLLAYRKHQTLEQIRRAIEIFHHYKIKVHGMFVLGGDDDVATIRATVRFAKKAKIDTVQFLMLTPLPGTPLYTDLKKQNRLLTENWANYDAHHVVFQPKKISAYILQIETIKAMRYFYSVWQIWKLLLPGYISKANLHLLALRHVARRFLQKWQNKITNQKYINWLLSHQPRQLQKE